MMGQQFHGLKKTPRCTDDLQRFLEFIESRMLVVDASKRANTREVVEFFQWSGVTCVAEEEANIAPTQNRF
jgi:hypothetical protein